MKARKYRLWLISALASLALHAPLWFLYRDSIGELFQESAVPMPVFTSRVLTLQELDRMTRRSRSTVESSAPEVDKAKVRDEAKYLSDRTRRVERETIARGRSTAPAPSPEPAGGSTANESGEDASSEKFRRLGIRGEMTLPQKETTAANQESSRVQSGTGIVHRSPAGEGGSIDVVLSDVARGSQTLLNSDEYVFASFFNRLKQQLEPRWSPVAQEIMKRQWRSLPEGIYVTELSLGTDDSGKVTFVEVVRDSGYAEFDRAAKDAVWDLGRLANLPRELLDRDSRYRTKLTFVIDFKKSGMRFDTITENEQKRWQQNVRKNR